MNTYSYSKLSTFQTCENLYKLKYIDKIKVPFSSNPIFEKGSYIHKIMEKYPETDIIFNFKFSEVSSKKFEIKESIIKKIESDENLSSLLLKNKIKSEYNFWMTPNFKPIKKKTGSKFNGIIDYIGMKDDTLVFIDWKSGKTKKATLEQLKFYTVWGFNAFTQINRIKIVLYFIELDETVEQVIERSELEEMQAYWNNLIEEIESKETFKKNGNSCTYCDYYAHCKPSKLENYK